VSTAAKEIKRFDEERLKKLLSLLTYEMHNGKPVYYRGFKEVLSGEKKPEEVMGSGLLHAVILEAILAFLFLNLRPKGYRILTGELGYRISKGIWYNLDIAVYKQSRFPEVADKFVEVPPDVVIEVDTKADMRLFPIPQEYFHGKTQNLLDSGVEKVIWIFTKEKKVWVAERDKRWIITDWSDTIEVLEGVEFNLEELLKSVKEKPAGGGQ